MKNYLLKSLLFVLLSLSYSCNSSETDPVAAESSNDCSSKNKIELLKYSGVEQAFEPSYTYANFNTVYKTYRVLYLNYPKSEDKDTGKKKPGQIRLVLGLFNPVGGEFKAGKYTLEGDENGMNRASIQVETESGLKTCNIQGVEETGSVEVLSVSGKQICGTFKLAGVNFEVAGEFNAAHEKVQ